MKIPAQFVAALLVVAVVSPRLVGFGNCCDHTASTAAVLPHHRHCDHEQMQEPVPIDRSLSAKGCHCKFCPSMVAGRTHSQVPQIVPVTFLQPRVAAGSTLLASVSPRIYSYTDPPPEDSSVRRASLCTFLI